MSTVRQVGLLDVLDNLLQGEHTPSGTIISALSEPLLLEMKKIKQLPCAVQYCIVLYCTVPYGMNGLQPDEQL